MEMSLWYDWVMALANSLIEAVVSSSIKASVITVNTTSYGHIIRDKGLLAPFYILY